MWCFVNEKESQGLRPEGITVFGSQLHTHLTGIRVYTRHFDAYGRELPELDRDNHYSTHFQEIRRLKKPVKVLPVSHIGYLYLLFVLFLTVMTFIRVTC